MVLVVGFLVVTVWIGEELVGRDGREINGFYSINMLNPSLISY